MHVVATAGHVDHGKSTLVLALTGTDPDRWAEEKSRGLTIDLGFAFTHLAAGHEVAFVDVPGHVRFLKNMLAGVGAVDACLFVVAATEGWKPQSEEHLRILQLLGVDSGVVALTKVAGLDGDDVELARLDVADRVAGTFLAGAEVVAVDAPSGLGIDELREALGRLVARTPTAVDRGRPRLWVDRSFAARGAGTVVTGTLAGGTVAVDDELVLWPSGQPVGVRGLQAHRASLERAGPGRRLAVNLTGVGHGEVERGDALVRPGQWAPTRTFDAGVDVLDALDHPVGRRGAYAVHLGSGEHRAHLRVLGADSLEPGASGFVRVHLPVALPLLPGDRYILRESGRGETVGGGVILDVEPVLRAAIAAPTLSVDRVVAERGWVDVHHLERLTGQRRAPDAGRWAVDPATLTAALARLGGRVVEAGALGLDVAALDERERAALALLAGPGGDVRVEGGRARIGHRPTPAVARQADAGTSLAHRGDGAGRQAEGEPAAPHPFVMALEASPYAPPTPEQAGVDRVSVRDLVRTGDVIERDGFFFAASAVASAAVAVATLLAGTPGGVTMAEVRDALGTSRKFVVPLVSLLDATGVTRRRGDVHVAGPRLPPPA